ncbi:MAG: hypothetical protein O2819_09180 [Planctomycetota bacterium]|nr:hypothetical protein [Planctomycetota bacterium]
MCVGGLAVAFNATADLVDSPIITFDCNGESAFDADGRPGFLPGQWIFEGDCYGSNFQHSYEIAAIVDPVLDFNFSWTNTTLQTQSYLFTFSLNGIDDWNGDILYSALFNATVHDNNGNGATLGSSSGLALFTGIVDGVPLLNLANSPFSLVTAPGGSATTGDLTGSGASSIGYHSSLTVRLSFTLSAGDSVGFDGDWTVNPVPAPGALALMALAGCSNRSRRRR